nr:F-box only protein 34 [Solea senegalensis]XP_043873969.1 F-box only protein 34 [Solea senegalensis]XP_043873970.1 F-box only protein 34 [Solea senegalensis]XP_043873971.1 F-box only protein 34 [Solea senegalensis]
MHLASYPKFVHSELCLDVSSVQTRSQRSSLFVSHQGALLKTCSGNYGNSSRLPFSVIATNALCGDSAASLRLKPSRSSCLQFLLQPPGCENDALCPTSTEDTDVPLDIWTVIKPGHVREKIAIFASEGQTERKTGDWDRPPSGPLRAVKAKGSWEENGCAKRRRRSGSNHDLQQVRVRVHSPSPARVDTNQRSGVRGREGEAVMEEEEPKVSVVEMVAFLEQRASEQQIDCKPAVALRRSCATITLSRAPPPEVREVLEAKGEEPESVRVSDMVAKLEWECLRRRSEGGVSRSSSLRRTVGRVLLAAGDQSPAPSHSTSSLTSADSSSSHPTPASPDHAPSSYLPTPRTPPSGEVGGRSCEEMEKQPEGAEPLPGLLFISVDSEPRPPQHRVTLEPCPESDMYSERSVRRKVGGASPDFLLLRQRVQQLLEPQPLLAVLPHHLLLHVLLLLPTRSLAALKCTCRYFRFVIDNYGVRPADSLWVSDPRYRDDPCKQCKRRYGRGDVSLCRWHHKPFCQAPPYGPGYWMCCHGNRRDTPGCNVGLHDNRWVPAFHSINVPICRRSHNDD